MTIFSRCARAHKSSRTIISFLCISFLIFTPLAPAFAQEQAAGGTSTVDTPVSQPSEPVSPPAETTSPPVEPLIDIPVEVTSEPAADTNVETQTDMPLTETETQQPEELLPDTLDTQTSAATSESTSESGGGSSSEGAEASAFNGAFTYTYPITIPPGRGDMTPNLELTYSSSGGSDHDLFGYGWSINIPYIERLYKSGGQHPFNNNDYYSSLSGELVRVGSTTEYKTKVEQGHFVDYEFANDAWTATTTDGTVYTFGSTTASRQNNASSTGQIHKWMVSEIRDTNDNYQEFTYHKDGNQIYPEKITYTGHGTTDGDFAVEFDREAKTQAFINHYSAFETETQYRIKEIRAEIDNAWVRKYALTYATGDNAKRDLLTEITESGQEDGTSVTKSLPAEKYTYEETNLKTWSYASSYDLSTAIDQEEAIQSGDFDGDGLSDTIALWKDIGGGSSGKYLYINDGNGGFVSKDTSGIPSTLAFFGDGSGSSDQFYYVFPVDLTGDGKDDFLDLENMKAYINQGDLTWVEDPAYAPSNLYDKEGYRVGDRDADGLVDLVYGNEGSEILTWPNTGTGWGSFIEVDRPGNAYLSYNGSPRSTNLIDVNRDRRADLHDLDSGKIYIGQENLTFVEDPEWFLQPTGDVAIRYGDINSDEDIDFIKHQKVDGSPATYDKDLRLGNGNGWTLDATWRDNLPNDAYFFLGPGARGRGYASGLSEYDGDGSPDLYDVNNEHVYLSDSIRTDHLTQIEKPEGGTIAVEYTYSREYNDGSNDLNTEMPMNVKTVSKVTFNSGEGNTWEEDYTYAGGTFDYASTSVRDRKFAGFATTTKTTDLSKTTTYFHQNNGNATSTGETSDDFWKIGFPYRTEIDNLSGDNYETTVSTWESVDIGDDARFVKQTKELILDYDGDTDHKDRAEAMAYDNANGNLLELIEYGEVNGSSDGTFTDTGTDKRTTTYTYASSTTSDVASLPSRELVVDNASSTVRDTKYYYDTLSQGAVSNGNLTKRERWATSTTYIDDEWTYNSYGLVTEEKDPRDKTTTYDYDSRNLFVASSTDAEGNNTRYTYDYSSGQARITTDPNGEDFETEYDALDRVDIIYIPDPSDGSKVAQINYEYTDTRGAVAIERDDKLSSSLKATTKTYLDGFDRVIQERVEAEDTNTYSVRDFVFGAAGLLKKESLPYFDEGSTQTTKSSDSDLYTEYGYDALERIVAATTTLGTTNTDYDQWTETVTDPLNNDKDFAYDAFERLEEVKENTSTSTYTTTYAWDHNDNLTKITDALDNVRNIAYDGLSRRTSLEDLHDSSDTTFGIWTFAYDDSSNLTSQTDPESQTINFTYDDINRVLTEDYTGESGTELAYTYDTCTNGKGRLCEVSNGAATTSYTYNPTGLIDTETRIVDGTTYATEYEYDRQENQTLIAYPDNSEVRQTFNTANQLEKIEQRENGGTFADVIRNLDYGPHGLVTIKDHGNGARETKTYDENALYRLASLHIEGYVASASTSSSTPNNLTQNLISYWELEESSGTRIDSHSTNDVADNNTVTSGTGKQGTAAQFTNPSDNGEYLSIADGSQSGLDITSDLAFSVWVNADAYQSGNHSGLVAKYHTGQGGNVAYWSSIVNDGGTHKLDFIVHNGTSLSRTTITPTSGNFSTGTWYHVVASYNATAGSVDWYVNGTSTGSGTGLHSSITNSSHPFTIGRGNEGGADQGFDGRLDEVAIYDRTLDSTDVTALYNSGSGLSHAEILNGSTTATTTTISSSTLKYFEYAYDSVGNITEIVATIGTSSIATTTYGYDDLYRLTSASTTGYAGGDYLRTYAYNAIGNITSKSDQGTYKYEGDTGSNYANAHAATEINGTSLTYDKNGNLKTYGSLTNTWDYQNRLTRSVESGITVDYLYDHEGQRVSKDNGTTTTLYPSSLYEIAGATTTKHIYAGEELVATIEGDGSATSTYHNHLDHLNSTRVVTNASGTAEQRLDYYPFGAELLDDQTGDINQTNRYTGHNYDEETNQSYLGARYYDGSMGRFTSQDPVSQSIGAPDLIRAKTTLELEDYLRDPQGLNSYSYARNNPIRIVDENGEWFEDVVTGRQSFGDFQIEVGQATMIMTQDSAVWAFAVDHPYTAAAVTALLSGGAFSSGATGLVALKHMAYPGVGTSYIANRGIEGALYLYLAQGALENISDVLSQLADYDPRNPSLEASSKLLFDVGLETASTFGGETAGGVAEIISLMNSTVEDISVTVEKIQQREQEDENED